MEDKENAIFELKKDLRNVKEQLNTEKIRHRRSQVVHSRIPAPTTITKSTASSAQKSTVVAPGSAAKANGRKSTSTSINTPASESYLARVRSRVLRILQDHDPQKVGKIDILMKKYSGREYELLEKMTAKYNANSAGRESTDNHSTTSTISTVEDRPMSRQERALASHKARMQGIKNRR